MEHLIFLDNVSDANPSRVLNDCSLNKTTIPFKLMFTSIREKRVAYYHMHDSFLSSLLGKNLLLNFNRLL